MLPRLYVLFFTILVCWISLSDGVAVMSVDLGSEWMKIAIVKPGVPMEIALNKESQRKTPVVISLKDERLFGEAAANLGVRFPKNAYRYSLDLLGKTIDNDMVKIFRKRFPYYDLIADEDRGTVLFQHDSETVYSPEELFAMILNKAKEIASSFAEQPVKDAVITIPPFFNQAERKSLLQAAQLAGLNVLQLMNDNTAVALNYGVFRRKDFNESKQYIMLYDMGASKTTATIVAFQTVKVRELGRVETYPQLSIKGVGFDRTLGGLEMQLRLRDFLARAFNDQKLTKNDIFQNPRAMAKLFKEAGRVKNVLSANQDHFAQVEGLLDEKDFKFKVTRVDFEELCDDLFKRVGGPVQQALKASQMSLEEIDSVIMVGAGTRVPKVQQYLLEAVKKSELGKNLNTDEAAALGAVYQAAHLSKGFKVKKFIIKDANLYPIQVEFERESKEDFDSPKIIKRVLFGHNNPFPQKKVITFSRHSNDFSFYVNYGDLSFLPDHDIRLFTSFNLSKVGLSGVSDALSKHQTDSESKGIKAHFRMDDSGVLYLDNVESVFEKLEQVVEEESTLSKLGSTITNFFSGSKTDEEEETVKKDEEPETEESTENSEEQKKATGKKPEEVPKIPKDDEDKKVKEETSKVVEENKTETVKGNATEEAKKDKPKRVVVKEKINFTTNNLDLPELTENHFKKSQRRLNKLDRLEKEKFENEHAKNALESFILDTRDKLSQPDYESCSLETEREEISSKLNEASDWLYDDGSDQKAEIYKEKLKSLEKLCVDLFFRVKEKQERPKALEALKTVLNYSEFFLASARNLSEDDQIFTEVELISLDKMINETKEWRTKIVSQQKKQLDTIKPVLLIQDIAEKITSLDREVKYLLNKAKLSKPKPKKTEKPENETKVNETEFTNTEKTDDSAEESEDSAEEKTIDEIPQLDPTVADDEANDDETTTKRSHHSQIPVTDDKAKDTETSTKRSHHSVSHTDEL